MKKIVFIQLFCITCSQGFSISRIQFGVAVLVKEKVYFSCFLLKKCGSVLKFTKNSFVTDINVSNIFMKFQQVCKAYIFIIRVLSKTKKTLFILTSLK